MSHGAFRGGLGLRGGDRAADLAFPGAEPGQCLGCALVIGAEQGEQEVIGPGVTSRRTCKRGTHTCGSGRVGRLAWPPVSTGRGPGRP